MRGIHILCSLLLVVLAACSKTSIPEPQQLQHGRFSAITVYPVPDTDNPPLLLLADQTTEHHVVDDLVVQARQLEAPLFVIDARNLLKDFGDEISNCDSLGGDFDNLARYVEAYLQMPGFIPSLLVSTDATAPFVDSVLTPLPQQVFADSMQIATGAKPEAKPACNTAASPVPAVAMGPGFDERIADRYSDVKAQVPAIPVLDDKVAMLPLTELPADGNGDTLAILLSGDGGWAGFDRDLAEALRKSGVSVVGWDSLRYFWQQRTPESLAADIDTVIAYYREHWHKSRVLLLGFSQGANVLPFTLDLVDKDSRAAMEKIALISPESYAQFEFHLGNWIHDTSEGLALAPVLDHYEGNIPIYCIYGTEDEAAVCPSLSGNVVQVREFASGHHLHSAITDIVAMLGT